MPAWGMQAERQKKEVSVEDGVPPIEAAGLRSNTGLLVAHIHSSAVASRPRIHEMPTGPSNIQGPFF